MVRLEKTARVDEVLENLRQSLPADIEPFTKERLIQREMTFWRKNAPLGYIFMVGATMIESAERGAVTARSAIELLSAAYALHPAFGEAEIVETRADVRPAFPDNLQRIVQRGATTYLNGFYRHGFLLSPAFAQQAAATILRNVESAHENHRQRRRA